MTNIVKANRVKKLFNDNSYKMLQHHIKKIEEGEFLYGKYNFNFFATFKELTNKEVNELKEDAVFSELPTHSVVYWHFHQPKRMLIGTTFYLKKTDKLYFLVSYKLSNDISTTDDSTVQVEGGKVGSKLEFRVAVEPEYAELSKKEIAQLKNEFHNSGVRRVRKGENKFQWFAVREGTTFNNLITTTHSSPSMYRKYCFPP